MRSENVLHIMTCSIDTAPDFFVHFHTTLTKNLLFGWFVCEQSMQISCTHLWLEQKLSEQTEGHALRLLHTYCIKKYQCLCQ